MVEFERAEWPRQIAGTILFGLLIVPLSIYRSDPYLVGFSLQMFFFFFLFMSLASIAGIWFGAWGILAACLHALFFPTFHGCFSPPYVEVYDLGGVIFQAVIPALIMRHYKVDPRLLTEKDAGVFWLSVFLASFLSTFTMFAGPNLRLWIPSNAIFLIVLVLPWSMGISIFTILVGFMLLQKFSRRIIKARACCKGWFS